MHPERRLAPRYPVTLQIKVNGGTGWTTNISSNGVYFETAHLVASNQEIAIVFPLEHAGPAGMLAECSARVLRVERVERGYGVAARYEAIAFEMP